MTNGSALRPHRATLILVLGILGLLCCVVCGIVAWVMGNSDMKEMAAGTMDPSGLGMTKAGKILGIISVALTALYICFYVLMLVGAVAMPAMMQQNG